MDRKEAMALLKMYKAWDVNSIGNTEEENKVFSARRKLLTSAAELINSFADEID